MRDEVILTYFRIKIINVNVPQVSNMKTSPCPNEVARNARSCTLKTHYFTIPKWTIPLKEEASLLRKFFTVILSDPDCCLLMF